MIMVKSEYLLIKNREKVKLAQSLLAEVHPTYGINISALKLARLSLEEVRDRLDDEIEGCIDNG